MKGPKSKVQRLAVAVLAASVCAAKEAGHIDIVSSSHQDTAWMDTPGFCKRFRIEQNILPALALMEKDAGYCFAMECALHLMEFLEEYPGRRGEVEKRMREGRLEFGATYNQPYESWLSGEELVRQVYYGRRWIRKNFPGCDARVAYNPDVPGRALQMQQILAKAGVPYLFISRYHEGFYRWVSPDGSSVLAYTPGHYVNDMEHLKKGADAVAEKLAWKTAYHAQRGIAPEYAFINSADFSEPTDFTALIAAWNARPAPRPVMRYAAMTTFFDAAAKGTPRFDARMGERPDVWCYIHGPTHRETSALRREAARLLPAAEAFGVFAGTAPALDQAWMDELYADHGIGGKNGHVTDEVFRRKVLSARDTARRALDAALTNIAARVKASPPKGAVPVVVFNTLPWTHSGPVEWMLPGEPKRDVHAADQRGNKRVWQESVWSAPFVYITDEDGNEVPCQENRREHIKMVNFALAENGAKAVASSSFNSHYGPEKAIDGKWRVRDPNPETGDAEKWNTASGAAGPHWLEIDFGQPRHLWKIVIRHEGAIGAFGHETKDNTADYTLQGRVTADGAWQDIASVVGNADSLTAHGLGDSKELRYLRLTVTKGSQTGNAYARIYEVEAFGPEREHPPAVVFAAKDVPGFGYKTFYAQTFPSAGKSRLFPVHRSPVRRMDTLENAFYRVTLAPGGIAAIFDKGRGRELLATGGGGLLGGELFTMLSVAPDDRGRGTDAGEFGAVPQPVMDASFVRAGKDSQSQWYAPHVEKCAVATVAKSDFVLRGVGVTQTVTLWNDLPRIDIGVTLHDTGGELWREYRAVFPFALDQAQLTYGVPMGVVRIGKDEVHTTGGHAYGHLDYHENCADIRPREVLDFVDASDAMGGVTLTLGGGLSVFDWRDATGLCAPGAAVVQPVLLATRKSCNGEGVWYPQTGTHGFRFSLTGHGGDWRQGWRAGIEANHPLEAVSAAPKAGEALPPQCSFLKVDAPNVRVTALKRSEDGDGVMVRLVEMEGRDCTVRLDFGQRVKTAHRMDIIETEVMGPLAVEGNAVTLSVGHHAIETVKVSLGGSRRGIAGTRGF